MKDCRPARHRKLRKGRVTVSIDDRGFEEQHLVGRRRSPVGAEPADVELACHALDEDLARHRPPRSGSGRSRPARKFSTGFFTKVKNAPSPALRSQMHAEPLVTSSLLEDAELLTAREREILALIGTAMTNKEIARTLKISGHTVKTHLHHIYVKLDKSGRYKAFLSNTAAETPKSTARRVAHPQRSAALT